MSSSSSVWLAVSPWTKVREEDEIKKNYRLALFAFQIKKNQKIIENDLVFNNIRANLKISEKPWICGFQNYDIKDFDGAVIEAPTSRVISNLKSVIVKYNCDTVLIDFEGFKPKQRSAYSNWIETVSVGLRLEVPRVKISVAVHAKTSDLLRSLESYAHDYKSLCESTDELLLMAYDEHSLDGGDPGPVASLDWVKQVLKFAVSQCQASKIRLGLAAFGYDWSSRQVVYEKNYDPAQKSQYVETEKQREIKIAMAQSQGISKFFIWALGMY